VLLSIVAGEYSRIFHLKKTEIREVKRVHMIPDSISVYLPLQTYYEIAKYCLRWPLIIVSMEIADMRSERKETQKDVTIGQIRPDVDKLLRRNQTMTTSLTTSSFGHNFRKDEKQGY
jgi:hypothetical protein